LAIKESIKPKQNGFSQKVPPEPIKSFQVTGLEANLVFPPLPKSVYKSSDFDDSFDFPFNPDPLASGNNYDIYDEMRHDDQVKASLSVKKDLVMSPGWTIECEDQEIIDFFVENFSHKMESSFDDSLRDIMSSFEYGFSLTEPIYRRSKTDGRIELKDLRTRPPHSFRFDLDVFGTIIKISQAGATGDRDFKGNYFLHHVYQPEFGNPFGQSDLRSAFEPWKMKKFFRRMWAIYVERFASPTIVGTAPPGTGPNELKDLFETLKTIQNSTVTVVPEGTVIEFMEGKKDSSDIYSTAIDKLNLMISRSILLPDMMGMAGAQTSGGSFALGKTQFQMFLGMISKEQEAIARKITLKIIRPMTLANFGDIPCSFAFKAFTEDNASENAKIWLEAIKSKIWTATDEEVAHFRDIVEFPEGDIERPEPMVPPGFGGNPEDPKKPGKPGTEEDPEEGDEPDPENDNEEARKLSEETITFREKTKFEAKIDFADVKRKLEVSDARVSRPLAASARDIWVDLISQIRKKNLFSGTFKPSKLNDIQPRFQKGMNRVFRRHFTQLYKDSFNQAQKEIFPDREKRFVDTDALLPEEFIKLIEAEAFKVVGDYSDTIDKKAKNIILEGIKEGVGEVEVLRRVREVSLDATDKWLKTVTRTKTTEIFNQARKSFYDNDPDAKQIIEAFEYSAIIDSRTSDVCDSLDGKIFLKGELTARITPPLHLNCRSLLVPVTKFEDFREDPNFVPPSKEPTIESLKKKGGNLLLKEESKTNIFSQEFLLSGLIRFPGDHVIVQPPNPMISVKVIFVSISNLSRSNSTDIALKLSESMETFFPRVIKPRETEPIKTKNWILDPGQALLIETTMDSDLSWTCKYEWVIK